MFAALLPSLRHLRAPVAAGYTWALALYLGIHRWLPSTSTDWKAEYTVLFDLHNILGRSGSALALSMLAYLVGSATIPPMAKLVRSRLFQQRHQMSPGTRRTDVRQGVERGMLYRIERLLEQLSPDGIDNSNTAREIRNECSGRSMMDRLLVTTPLLYAEADRHLSEAELRLGLIPPGVALAGVLAAGTGIPALLVEVGRAFG